MEKNTYTFILFIIFLLTIFFIFFNKKNKCSKPNFEIIHPASLHI